MKLNTAIEFLGKTYGEITFREPRGVDIAECGSPVRPGGGEYDKKAAKIDSAAVHNLMVACSDVPREVIDMLKVSDWMAGMTEIMNFFGDMVPETGS